MISRASDVIYLTKDDLSALGPSTIDSWKPLSNTQSTVAALSVTSPPCLSFSFFFSLSIILKMAHLEKESLLQAQHHDDSTSEGSYEPIDLRPRRSRATRKWVLAISLQFFLLLCYTAGALYFVRSHIDLESDPNSQAFAGLSVRYKFRLYDNFVNSPYAGEPTAESDHAWHQLLNNMSVRVTKEELAAHGQTSVELPNGGYLAWLGVFHELHCVKMLRQWSWRAHYFPNLTVAEHQHQMVHIDHCLDWLRNAAICRADTSALAVFKWDERMPHPMLNTHRVPHRCVDWDAMMTSHQDRLVSHDEVVGLNNPLMQPSE